MATKKEVPQEIACTNLVFDTGVEAWEKLNEIFLTKDPKYFTKEKVGINGYLTNTLFIYNVFITINRQRFNPKFDFGKHFNFSPTKWSGLISNYLDLDRLDIFKEKIRELEKDKTRVRFYNEGFHFSDSHDNGKGCLLSGIFSRCLDVDKPQLTLILRSSEVTTRLPIDILFFQRLGQYVYGHKDFILNLYLKQAYAEDTLILMYHTYKDLKEVFKDCKDTKRRDTILKRLNQLETGKEEDFIKYQPYFRAFKVIRKDLYGDKYKPLLAKDCIIGDWEGIPLPKDCPSIVERNRLKKIYLKFVNKYNLDMKKLSQPKKKTGKVTKLVKTPEEIDE